jgi:methionine biosynthesis protein MetW
MADTRANEYYDTYWRTEEWATRPPVKLVELLTQHVSATDRCLDVGCGDGGTSGVWLRDRASAYVGVDISESAVRMARERGLDAQQIEDAADLPFAQDSFDVAICSEVLEHLFQPQLALIEIRRVLRPGGRLIATVPNVAHWRNRLDLALLGRWNPRGDHLSPSEPWRDPHVRFFTVRSLASLFEQTGFDGEEVGGHAEHGFAHHVPGVRRLVRTPLAGPRSRRIAAALPALLAGNIYAVGVVPENE